MVNGDVVIITDPGSLMLNLQWMGVKIKIDYKDGERYYGKALHPFPGAFNYKGEGPAIWVYRSAVVPEETPW